jgi:hypothetical protein
MDIKYSSKNSSATIKLSWTEIRQFLSTTIAVEEIRDGIRDVARIAQPDWPMGPISRPALLVVVGDTEPEILGPYETEEERDQAARDYRRENGDSDGVYALDMTGTAEVAAYSGAFFEDDNAD